MQALIATRLVHTTSANVKANTVQPKSAPQQTTAKRIGFLAILLSALSAWEA